VNIYDGIKSLVSAKGLSEELIFSTIQEIFIEAYAQFKEIDDVKIIRDDNNALNIYIEKEIIEKKNKNFDPDLQILLKEAVKQLGSEELQIGEKVDILTDPLKDFNQREISWISENIINRLNNSEKDIIKSEYFNRKNKIVTGIIIKKDHEGNIYVDLGKATAMLAIEEQSPSEHYEVDDRIKAVVTEVFSNSAKIRRRKKEALNPKNIQVFLSRTSPNLVKELISMEVPEIADGNIQIKKITREPGYKTKIAVLSDTIEPVSPCIGPHGLRIVNVIKELGGEKIDIVKYSDEPRLFIKQALTPAKVDRIIIQDEASKTAFAIVPDKIQLAYAYGKQKKNVVLAAKLTGWKINVKTEMEAETENIESSDVRELKNIFMDMTPLSDLPEISPEIIQILEAADIHSIEHLVEIDEKNSYQEIENLKEEHVAEIKRVLSEFVEIEDDEEVSEESEEREIFEEMEDEEIECPSCSAKFKIKEIDLKSPACPQCHQALEIEFEE